LKYLTNSSKLLKILILAGAALLTSVAVQAEETRIGIISSQRIVSEALPYKTASSRLEQEFSKRLHDLQDMEMHLKAMQDKLEKDGPILSDADRAKRQHEFADQYKEFQRRKRELEEDENQRKNEELAAILERVNKVVAQIAEAEKFDIVLQDTGMLYHSPRVDITDKVLKVLNKQ